MNINFTGKRALVTGAGKGIGRTAAIRLAELGAHVIAVSRTQNDLDTLKAEVPSIEVCLLDVADWEKTREIVENMGHIDLLVNNAGITNWTSFLELTKEEVYQVHDINFKAALNISQVVARGMVSRGSGGAIVNVSSVGSRRATPNHVAYCTSKAAMDMLTTSTALELGPHQIRVNSVNPTVVMTAMGMKGWGDPIKQEHMRQSIPMKRFPEESDVVDTICYLLSDRAGMVTGSIVPVDGGCMYGTHK